MTQIKAGASAAVYGHGVAIGGHAMQQPRTAITLAITGASGAPYALRLLECLLAAGEPVYLLLSDAARVVIPQETGWHLPDGVEALAAAVRTRFAAAPEQLQVHAPRDWFSPVASGSNAPRRMVICPCSMGTLAAIAHGMSDNLIERAADVVIKEKGQLLLVPREMPFSEIHLDNMARLARAGAMIMPAAPGFYQEPQTVADLVDFVVARILDQLGVAHTLGPRWGHQA